MINSKLSAGIGITYQYYRFAAQTSATQISNVSFNIYGGRLFGRFNLTEQFFAYTEYENISVPYFDVNYDQYRYWVPAAYIGGGYIQRFGGARGGIGITALYNVLYNSNSISNSPFTIRFGFFF